MKLHFLVHLGFSGSKKLFEMWKYSEKSKKKRCEQNWGKSQQKNVI